MPGKKPLADEAGVLKSACASIQTMPQRPPPRPATTPIAASHDPASTIGSRAVLIADRTATRTPWLTASDAAATPAPTPDGAWTRWWVAVTPLPASRLWAPARAYRPGAAPPRVGHLFPRLLGQSEYNQRLKDLAPLLEAALRRLADKTPGSAERLRLLDGTPVGCGQSTITAKRSDLFGSAGYGYEPAHSRYYRGVKLLLVWTAEGTVTGFGQRRARSWDLPHLADAALDGQGGGCWPATP